MKRAVFLLLLCAMFLMPLQGPHPATASYSYSFTGTNLYTDYPLQYRFEDLDADTEYTISINALGFGSYPAHLLGQVVFSGVTEYDLYWLDWESITIGPVSVTDQDGRKLATHFLLPAISSSQFVTTETPDSAHDSLDKTYIARVDLVEFPPENDLTTLTIHDRIHPFMVTAVNKDILILHYRLNPFEDVHADTVISNIADATTLATFDMQCFIDYQIHPDWAGDAFTMQYAYLNFVVLSTNGKVPEWTNIAQENAAYVGCTDPNKLTIPFGGYDYGRIYNSGSHGDATIPGESVFIRSGANNSLFEFVPRVDNLVVSPDGEQTLSMLNETEEVWDAFSEQEVTDSLVYPASDAFLGTLKTDYARRKNISYAVPDDPDPVTVHWYGEPIASNYGNNPTEYGFDQPVGFGTYTVANINSIGIRAENWFIEKGIWTPIGKLWITMVALLLSCIPLVMFRAKPSFYGYVYALVIIPAAMLNMLGITFGIFAIMSVPVVILGTRFVEDSA